MMYGVWFGSWFHMLYIHELRKKSGRESQEYNISTHCLFYSNQLFDFLLSLILEVDKSNMVNDVPTMKMMIFYAWIQCLDVSGSTYENTFKYLIQCQM